MSRLALSVRGAENIFSGPLIAFADVALLGVGLPPLGKPVATNVAISVQGGMPSLALDLRPGRYRVTATLPSGEYLTEVVDVPPEGTSVTLTDEAAPKDTVAGSFELDFPRLGQTGAATDIALQEFHYQGLISDIPEILIPSPIGNEESQSIFEVEPHKASTNFIGAFTGKPLNRYKEPPSSTRRIFDIVSTSVGTNRPWDKQFQPASFAHWIESLLHRADIRELATFDSHEGDVSRYAGLPANLDDALWPLQNRNRVRLERVNWYRQRYLVAVSDQLVEQVVVLPLSWGERHLVGTIRDIWDSERYKWNVQVDMADGDFASVIGYLSRGDSDKALRVLRTRPESFRPEVQNPYAAVVGAYVLMYSSDDDIGNADWPVWIQNLATWYPGIPDAQILLATMYLQRRRVLSRLPYHHQMSDYQRLGTVWKLLKLAMLAGIPIFSRGARLLVDNLEILSFEVSSLGEARSLEFEGLSETLDEARRIDSCMQSVEPFSVLSFQRKQG